MNEQTATIFIGYPRTADMWDGWFYRVSDKETDETLNIHWNKTRIGALNKRRSTIRHWNNKHNCVVDNGDNGDNSYTTLEPDPYYNENVK